MRYLKDERYLNVYAISCDLCEKVIGTERPNAMGTPTNNLRDGVITITSGVNDIDICESCRYAGAVDKDTITELKTIKEQLKQTGHTASKVLTYTDTTAESKRTARLVIADAELCVDNLNKVISILSGVGA